MCFLWLFILSDSSTFCNFILIKVLNLLPSLLISVFRAVNISIHHLPSGKRKTVMLVLLGSHVGFYMKELCFLQDDDVKAEGEEFAPTCISCGEAQLCKEVKGKVEFSFAFYSISRHCSHYSVLSCLILKIC